MFRKILVTVIIAIFLLVIASFYFFKNEKPTSEYPITRLEQKIIYINGRPLKVEIADEPHEQSRGLSGREFLKANEGMLFVFSQSDKHSFWMKDMKFPLDIIWIDEKKTMVDMAKNLSPEIFPATFSPSSPVKYVLEINAGWSDRHNIKVGDTISF
ncbi:MAG: hypothetical protein A3B86_02905 [Candidatus Yanofskybacteria bacterium RIFCSPHIGHO2_02_FULL_38_22b]|uniref:DUF192 domain-containing protein n=1 Tax=Candidatus Yanofskybacteria bacterium RIFCSPHIGHO2_02_FULL_38_22b TaxID=1802673 RepID=A0A1F8F101_9BACT|nr:MAG: hypothetical protein A2816_02495 [Candidatus Yanofskybacteria bacterium RIFCSPHIGHO2_01_FULL_39_44]OGN06821.1 MAG: hypothetical protein A3B86_02905 [Candidatus Yanofskybacteria bacterium RIFCSPHIGHO2_02_FULL_38_22b]OGN20716.1 MAG: hypothetical protein A2910_00865 [Candidatus Yanofskybacteria bacterium RIFCSPLOWO2_01_FULL_39_28]